MDRFPPVRVVAGLAAAVLLHGTPPAAAQPLQDLLRRSVEDALRNATRPASPAPPPAPVAPAPAPATAPAPAPVPPVVAPAAAPDPTAPIGANAPTGAAGEAGAPGVAGAPGAPAPAAAAAGAPVAAPVAAPPAPAVAAPTRPPARAIDTLETRLADGPRTLDLSAGTPPELRYNELRPGARTVMSNPYVPLDRRFIEHAAAMACHPQGGLVVWASTRRVAPPPPERGRAYDPNATGLWRVEADGRVRALWTPTFRPTDDGWRSCGVQAEAARRPNSDRLVDVAVQPDGAVVVADRNERTLVRLRTDGFVEHVAGGGPDFCETNPARRRPAKGWRDGPARDALFSGVPSLAVDRAGAIYVAENSEFFHPRAGCSLRRIDPSGVVETVHGRGQCESGDTTYAQGHRMPGYHRITIDPQGRPIVLGIHRSRREGTGPEVMYTNVHRIEGGRDTLLMRAGFGSEFDPYGHLVALGVAPDGTPLAFNVGHYSDAGLVHLDNGKRFRYWWRSAPGMFEPQHDGPRGTARLTDATHVCAGTDGRMYLLGGGVIRRIDPATGAVDTWLH